MNIFTSVYEVYALSKFVLRLFKTLDILLVFPTVWFTVENTD